MKERPVRETLYQDWQDWYLQDRDLEGFNKIADLGAEIDRWDDFVSAAAGLQREAWLHGFDYAIKLLMNQ